MRSACSTSSARDTGHGGRWWTLRGRRNQRPPPAGTTEPPAEQEETRSPLRDSNRRPPLYEEGPCVNWVGLCLSSQGGCCGCAWWVGLISLSPPHGRTRLIGVRSCGAAP